MNELKKNGFIIRILKLIMDRKKNPLKITFQYCLGYLFLFSIYDGDSIHNHMFEDDILGEALNTLTGILEVPKMHRTELSKNSSSVKFLNSSAVDV